MRTETDFIGQKQIPVNALYGIHSLRAKENFPDDMPFTFEWFRAMGVVKKACYLTYQLFKKASLEKYLEKDLPLDFIKDEILEKMIVAAEEISAGEHFESFIVPAVSGGAGTSINMNINEIIANRALILSGHEPGNYQIIDPVEDANVFQSTNDVVPTALRVSLLFLLEGLEKEINSLRNVIEEKEKKHHNDLRVAYTQMQEALPSSTGKLFSTYNDALSRDWWRVSKCVERLKPVNLGGGATGSGLSIPRFYIMEVVSQLSQLTGLPVARGENLGDTTSNLDAFVEVHAILKAHAVNLEKMVSDIRLLASDVAGNKEFEIPARQVGSSIMPGKINPVIPEFVISAAHTIYANDQLITSLCAQGCLELNAYLPVIGNAMIRSLKLLIAADRTVKDNMFTGLIVNPSASIEKLFKSPVITTALIPFIGYNNASVLAKFMRENNCTVFVANSEYSFLEEEKIKSLLTSENLLKLGYLLSDLF